MRNLPSKAYLPTKMLSLRKHLSWCKNCLLHHFKLEIKKFLFSTSYWMVWTSRPFPPDISIIRSLLLTCQGYLVPMVLIILILEQACETTCLCSRNPSLSICHKITKILNLPLFLEIEFLGSY